MKKSFTARPARDNGEVENALNLVCRVFTPPKTQAGPFRRFKEKAWRTSPGFRPEDVIVLLTPRKKVAGAIKMTPRILKTPKGAFQTMDWGDICIDPAYRGKNLSRPLMNAALRESQRRGVRLAHLIARRKVDGYYKRFGFVGLSSYPKYLLKVPEADRRSKPTKLTLKNASLSEAPRLKKVHEDSYRRQPANFKRPLERWVFLINLLSLQKGVSLKSLYAKNRFAGYAVFSGSTLHEIAFLKTKKSLARDFFPWFAHHFGSGAMECEIPPCHALAGEFQNWELSFSVRQAPEGGHMGALIKKGGFKTLNSTRAIESETGAVFRMLGLHRPPAPPERGKWKGFYFPLLDQF